MSRRLALITGASAGIGAAFARVYAARGYDLALTARRTERLEALAAELREAHGADTLVIAEDLAGPEATDAILGRISEAGRQVDALVNNAGYGLPGTYLTTPWERQRDFLQVLTVAPCELAHRLLPGMTERGSGRIVNVASLAGLAPGAPGATLYAASKAFLIRFSQSLHLEVKAAGVHVSALCPGFTVSEFHDVTGTRDAVHAGTPRWAWQTAEAVAEAGYRAVEANHPICVPGAPNKALAALAKLAPDDWVMRLMGRRMARMRGAD